MYFLLPEVKGRSLEEIDELFQNRVPLREFPSYACVSAVRAHEAALHDLGLDHKQSGEPVVTAVESAEKAIGGVMAPLGSLRRGSTSRLLARPKKRKEYISWGFLISIAQILCYELEDMIGQHRAASRQESETKPDPIFTGKAGGLPRSGNGATETCCSALPVSASSLAATTRKSVQTEAAAASRVSSTSHVLHGHRNVRALCKHPLLGWWCCMVRQITARPE